jgi:hypothetical protein
MASTTTGSATHHHSRGAARRRRVRGMLIEIAASLLGGAGGVKHRAGGVGRLRRCGVEVW